MSSARRAIGRAWLAVGFLAACALNAQAQRSEHALRFFGTGASQLDRVRIPIDDDLPGPDASSPCDVGAASFTLECWVRGTLADNPTAHTGGGSFGDFRWIEGNVLLDRDVYGGTERDFGVSLAGGFVRFGTGRGDALQDGENTLEAPVNVLDGAWHHVACVRDAATGVKRIFVDGVLAIASAPNTSRTDLSYPNAGAPGQVTPWGPYLVVAAEKHDAGAAYPSFAGYVDELRVWNVARTELELRVHRDRVLPAGTPGLVGAYRFEEGAGTSAADSSGSGAPNGQVIAGASGNGEWVSRAANPLNTAPMTDEGGVALCAGDGSLAPCPCGNDAPAASGRGCLNSLGVGAWLVASGRASLANDGLVLTTQGLPAGTSLYFQGSAYDAPTPLGDGLRCAGGALVRLGTRANAGGASSYPPVGGTSISVRGSIAAPGAFAVYQVWYRNAASFCTSATFNTSNAVGVVWGS
ncbi:MAG: LamG domain-containing protein [Planctomycetes bacterium]|nr:LamG domain-containing protein [Planctomycetota bacterium]